MTRIRQWAQDHATGRNVLLALGAFFLFALVVFPAFDAVNGLPEEAEILDTRTLGYTAADARALFEELGRDGRIAYIRSLLIVDVAWPIIYGVTLLLMLAWGSANRPPRTRALLLTLPVVTVGIDAVENTMTILQLARFPAFTPWFASTAGVVTLVKWIVAYGSTILALIAVLARLARRRGAA